MAIRSLVIVLPLAGLLTLAACDRARDPSQVAADLASAEQSAQQKDAAVAKDASEKVAKAGAEVSSDRRQLTHEEAVEHERVTETDAAGAHKVAIAQCEALSGQAQSVCKKRADADLDVAMAVAKQSRTREDPNL
jgi:hypothetical protein